VLRCSQTNCAPEACPSRASVVVVASPFFFCSLTCGKKNRQNLKASSRHPNSNQYALVLFCTCQEACHGQVIVSVDDDASHAYDVLGQRIGVAVFHPSG
jgi:hypothetical protein